MARSVVVFGKLVARQSGNSIKGYTVRVAYECVIPELRDPAGAASVTAPVAASRPAEDDGSFRVEVQGPGDPVALITVRASSPDHSDSGEKQFSLAEVARAVTIEVDGYRPFTISSTGESSTRILIQGRAIDKAGKAVPQSLAVVIFGVDQVQGGDPGPPRVVATGRTQVGGFFSLPWVPDRFISAFARIAGGTPVPIRLEDTGILPLQVVVVVDSIPQPPSNGSATPPRAPDPSDLSTNPAAFSQDLGGGCVNLSMPDRTIEEYSYFIVVRTTEPEVKGFSLSERSTLPPKLIGDLIMASATTDALSLRTVAPLQVNALSGLTLDASSAGRLLRGDRAPSIRELARASWISELDRAKDLLTATVAAPGVRTDVDDNHPIHWDYNDTKIYESVSIAHGHILEYREVWRADGYSLGDLLSSLPLAPGQRRQVAVVDWDRRSQAAREERLEFEEELQSAVTRDRDIREIVGSRLDEELQAGSKNTTWGAAGGFGAGLIQGTFGIFGGVAGGASGSNSTAWQDASRRFSAESMQNLRDRVTQRASSLRDQRSTVVQTVAQGETWRAETEVIANYNRCHTITVEYFEVLRHFVVTHELAGVRECLFVPFTMRAFDVGKALRWRETLERFLRDSTLQPGFDAMQRVADQWEGWDYPVSRYSEEPPIALEGEMRISFVLPRPRDDQDGKFQISQWRQYSPFLPRDTYELWIANLNGKAARERDQFFRANVAPEIAQRLIASLKFAYITSTGNITGLTLDGTLVSRYAEGVPLYATLRPSGGLPPIPREQISGFQIGYEGSDLPEDARVVVHSGKMRYQTPNLIALLFNEPRILNDLRPGDPVTISTPLSRAEARNPRQEDRDLADKLVRHLNDNLEYYHQAIWAGLDPERRFILLDGMLIPGTSGLSVASVVENRLIGIAGNSMIFPLAPGLRLDPRITDKSTPLEDLYQAAPTPPLNIAVPTRGVYAEAVLGNCSGCEKIDETRYWRWTTEGMLAPPPIAEVTTQRPAGTEPNLTPTPLPAPLVSIQAAPELPNPTSLASVLGLLAKPDLFRDITGLAGTQANAQKAFSSAMTNMTAIGSEAAALAKQQLAMPNTQRTLDRLQGAVRDGLLTPEAAQHFAEGALRAAIGAPANQQTLPTQDPAIKKAVDAAAQSKKAEVKITTPTETVEAKFEDKGTQIGATPVAGALPIIEESIDQDFIVEAYEYKKPIGSRTMTAVRIRDVEALKAVTGHAADTFPIGDVDPRFFKVKGSGPLYQITRRLLVVFPESASAPGKVDGTGRLPLAVLVHGNHAAWQPKKRDDVPSFIGYAYFQKFLAEQGIISVSVDCNAANYINALVEMRAEMILEAMQKIRKLDGDSGSPLFGRVDFSRVALMGHSRGGDAVVRAALKNRQLGDKKFGIKAVCSLSPTDTTGTASVVGLSSDIRTFVPDQIPDVFQDGPYSLGDNLPLTYLVVYGGLDGDVSGKDGPFGWFGTGFRHYDRAKCPKAMVFLHHCNHNRFNTIWKNEVNSDFGGADDSEMSPLDLGPFAGTPGRVLPEADHRKLVNEYVGGFFRWHLKGETALAGLFTGDIANTVHAEAGFQWSFSATTPPPAATPVPVKDLEDMEDSVDGQIAVRELSRSKVDPFGKFTTHTLHQTGVLQVEANIPAPAQTTLKLTFFQRDQDWHDFKWLQLRICADADLTDLETIKNSPLPEFEIELIDTAGGSAALDQSKFGPPMTRPVYHDVVETDDSKTPPAINVISATALAMTTVRAPLASFSGVNLKAVEVLLMRPGAGFARNVYFDSVQIAKD